jgi:hypothetical protein
MIPLLLAALALGGDPSIHPWPIGPGPRYRPPAQKLDGSPVGALRCATDRGAFEVHVEVFVNRRVVIVPAGIGQTERCDYPIRTRTPIGVLDVAHGRRVTIGDLFRLWGQPLTRHRIASFRSAPMSPASWSEATPLAFLSLRERRSSSSSGRSCHRTAPSSSHRSNREPTPDLHGSPGPRARRLRRLRAVDTDDRAGAKLRARRLQAGRSRETEHADDGLVRDP